MTAPAWDELDPPRIVYVPRPIETAEQAAALPIGTVATSVQADLPSSAVKAFGGEWTPTTGVFLNDRHMIGWTALVPAEVYEGPGGHGPSWYIQADEYDR